MDKCPYCGAETRPADNFCLNCGNRLLTATPSASSQQAQPATGDATIAAPDDWGRVSGSGSGWVDESAQTVAGPEVDAGTQSADSSVSADETVNEIEQPARFILRSESGEVLQEYPLDKAEISIGRAPNSDILLSKDKLTSRRHATVHYENGQYLLRDERSANGTFVNGQQIDENVPKVLNDGDHVGIGEHELIFRTFASASVENEKTIMVPVDSAGSEMTYRTNTEDPGAISSENEFSTRPVEEREVESVVGAKSDASYANGVVAASSAPSTPFPVPGPVSAPLTPVPVSSSAVESASRSSSALANDNSSVTFNRLTNLPQPTLPDLSNLTAALSTLDGQIMSLQEQFNATQEAMRSHESEVIQTSNQLRQGIRRVSERMDNTIADVARSREALAWAELMQLMDDVMNNPRDIEYVTKLARKARELNKVFQIHQNVLNTMAECNSLLRSMIGEDK
jgi:pSer/pThr/pTyr-binding forkhead associated (FHA) protein